MTKNHFFRNLRLREISGAQTIALVVTCDGEKIFFGVAIRVLRRESPFETELVFHVASSRLIKMSHPIFRVVAVFALVKKSSDKKYSLKKAINAGFLK